MTNPTLLNADDVAARVRATIDAYNAALNDAEISPNGDDFNDLQDHIERVLAGGAVPVITVTEEGR